LDDYWIPASDEHQRKEKAKARELKSGSWWKQQVGRGICYHCEARFNPSDLTLDHLIPIARGGKSSKTNCVPCCKNCNTKKGAKTRAEMALEALNDQKNSAETSE
jgi:5-methylcytosine-specific restriction enzyme A